MIVELSASNPDLETILNFNFQFSIFMVVKKTHSLHQIRFTYHSLWGLVSDPRKTLPTDSVPFNVFTLLAFGFVNVYLGICNYSYAFTLRSSTLISITHVM